MKYQETPTIELKGKYTSSFLRSVSAFATFVTGKIYFGIDEQNGIILGVDNPVETKLSIENSIHDTISPRPDYSLETIDVDGKTVVELTVFAGDNGPYFYKNKVYHRADTSSAPIENSEVRKLIMESEGINYEALESTQSDLTFTILRKSLESAIGIEKFNKDTLRTLGLYKNNIYNRAAQLLADENDLQSAYIDMVRFGETESILLERKTIKGKSILTQYNEAMNFFDRWYHPYEEISGAYRETRIYIPKDGFREALANAIIHRDFMIHSFIRIAMYEDRIEITSPGTLPKGISEEDFLAGKVSVPRNRIIADVFNRLTIIEIFATGIKRIRAEYKPFKENPLFEVSENFITVILPKVTYDDKIISKVNSCTDNEELILRTLKQKGELSRSEMESHVNLSRSRLTDIIKKLIDENRIEKTGQSVNTRYRLK